jgi:hypothetical protein
VNGLRRLELTEYKQNSTNPLTCSFMKSEKPQSKVGKIFEFISYYSLMLFFISPQMLNKKYEESLILIYILCMYVCMYVRGGP